MKFLKSDIKSFKAHYFNFFDVSLTDEQAVNELTQLVKQVRIIYQPVTIAQLDEFMLKKVNRESKNELIT